LRIDQYRSAAQGDGANQVSVGLVSGTFRSELEISVRNDRGVLGRVAAEIAASEANIAHVSMDESAERVASLRFILMVRDRVHLARVLRNLRRLPEVSRISRHH
jgi:GTP pyrophosphokinase